VTPNEWITAGRLGSEYYLYIVTQALSKPELYVVRDPAANLSEVEELSVVRYVVPQAAWRAAAEADEVETDEVKV